MAILVAVAGAGLGSATGIGGALGWTIGSILGSLLFPSETRTEGPRLGDLSVSSSAYGSVIPIPYGTIRTSGNIIWSSGIQEKRHKKKSGGKGGGGQTSITYTYSVDFAIAFCEGPIDDVLRLWADGKLIFDKRGTGTNTKKKGLKFKLYTGSETQLQDPIIVADKGANATPAFRGLAYIVFDDMQLADFGNRIPSITAEVSRSSEVNRIFIPGNPYTTGEGGISASFQNAGVLVDFDRGFAYARSTSPSLGCFRRFNLRTMSEDRQIPFSSMMDTDSGEGIRVNAAWAIAPDGALISVTDDGGTGGNFLPISRFDPNSFEETARFGNNAVTGHDETNPKTFQLTTKMGFASGFDLSGRVDFLICGTTFGAIGVLKLPNLEYVWDSEIFSPQWGNGSGFAGSVLSIVQGEARELEGDSWVLGRSGTTFTVYLLTVATYAAYTQVGAIDDDVLIDDETMGVTFEAVFSFSLADIDPNASSVGASGNMVYDQTDGGLIFTIRVDGNARTFWVKYLNGALSWVTQIADAPDTGDNTHECYHFSRVRGGTLGFVEGNRPFLIDTASGELLENGSAPDYLSPSDNRPYGVYDSDTESYIGLNGTTIIGRWFFRRGSGNGTTVADIVEDICGRVGINALDLDLTDLVDDDIPGFILGTRTSARSAIEPLSSAFFFDGVESDFLLKFVQRGQSPVRTIMQDELMIVDGQTGESIREARQQEVELPERITVLYLDVDHDYQQGTQSSKRLLNPVPSMFSRNQLSMSIPAALEADFAKQLAEKSLYSAWTERASYEIQTDWGHLDLDPTDVVTIELNNGTQFTSRLTEIEIGDSLIMRHSGVSERAAQYTSTVVSDNGTGPLDQIINGPAITKLLLLDTPLLRDSDEPPGRASSPLYYFMGSYGNVGWRNALLYKSMENTNYFQVGQSVSPMTWGATTNALGNPPDGNPFATDTVNSITVSLYSDNDTIESITNLEMLNGANAAMLIKQNGEVEIIQFQDVTENGHGSFTLSTLLRGRRGTDTMCTGHTSGEIFLLLDSDDGDKFPLALEEIGLTRYYKGVGAGDFLEDSELVTKASLGRVLMPYAPVQFSAALDGSDIDLTWVRRTRVGGGWNNGTGSVPLNEDVEEYEIEILDAPGGTVVRTVTGLTAPEYTYTSADQTSDGFSPPLSDITFRVYQISAQVGRGFSREGTVDVE